MRGAPAPAARIAPASAARIALASIAMAYLALGPFVVQVLGVDTDFLLRWTMFNTGVSRMCLVEYREAAPDGSTTRVDRFEWLGVHDPEFAPPDVALIRSPEQALAVGQRLCRERPGSDLRVLASCARDGSWTPALLGDANLCAAALAEGAPR